MSMRMKIDTRKVTGHNGRSHTIEVYAVTGRDYHYQIYLDDRFWCTAESRHESDSEISAVVDMLAARVAS